jgi:hypothetical protein
VLFRSIEIIGNRSIEEDVFDLFKKNNIVIIIPRFL